MSKCKKEIINYKILQDDNNQLRDALIPMVTRNPNSDVELTRATSYGLAWLWHGNMVANGVLTIL